ncbi:MAG TPA: hypothetical protein VFL13_02025 [Candidatus Baltobacteraceae bacterium]|nr:hypothetical protein [Candidatus Baltobacteraceae bacterium]
MNEWMLSRRRLFVGAAAGAAALALAAWYEDRPDPKNPSKTRYAFLRAEDHAIVAAVAPVLTGRASALAVVPARLDAAIAGLPPATQAQLRQLFDLLGSPWGRVFVAGVPQRWSEANAASVAAFLQAWRTSPFERLRAGYDALHQLVLAAYYSDPLTWSQIGYAGPPRIS